MVFNGIQQFINCLHFPIGFQIQDLSTNDATFLADVESWTATAVRHGKKHSLCDGTFLLGGFDVLGIPDTATGVQGYYFQRIYENLPDHNIIYFTMSLWLIDSWDPSPPDYFQIQFDSVLVEGWSFGNGNFTGNFCGQEIWPDLKNMTVFGQVSHSGSSVTLRVISQLDNWAYDESLGLRNVNLVFANNAQTNVNNICGLSEIPLPTNQCSCSYGAYFGPFGCQTCDSSCRSCFGPTAQDCYECQAGYSYVNGECIKCHESCAVCSGPGSNECTNCPLGGVLFDNKTCISDCASTSLAFGTILVCDQPCLADQFYYEKNQTCSGTCNFPFIEETSASGVQLCLHYCENRGFLYWDGTCNSLCHFPLAEIIEDDKSVCLYNCSLEEFLYWDGTCRDTCDGSLIPGMFKNRQFCQYPCGNSDDFIYWNGTCGSTCEAPLLRENDGKAKYCHPPCSEAQPYWNGSSCLGDCRSPFIAREEDGILYCESPCNFSSEYLYWNGSCLDSCPPPYQSSSQESGMKFCSYLCEQHGDYFYPKQGECLASCDAPLIPKIQIIDDQTWYVACMNVDESSFRKEPEDEGNARKGPISGPFYYPITTIRKASEKIAGVFIALDIVLSLLNDSHVMVLILVIKIMNFVKYLDIQVPPQLMQELGSYDQNHFYLNFGPGMSEGMRAKFTRSSLPMVFERAGLHSRFLVNFFKPISSFLIMLGFMGMIAVLQRHCRRKKDAPILVKIILKRLETYLRWNLVVLLVICNIDEIVLYSVLEWETVDVNSVNDIISLLMSLGMFVLAGVVIVAPFYLLNKIYNVRFKVLSNLANEPYFELLKKIEGFQVLWKDFKDSSFSHKSFLPLYMLRIALMYLIVAVLYEHPLGQMILMFLMNLGMLIFMSIVKPFMKSLDFIQSLAYEVLMLMSVGSTLILAVLDSNKAVTDQIRLFMGDCIQFFHILLTLTAVVIFLAKFYKEIESARELYRTLPKPMTRQQFWVLVLQENDPIAHELKRNKRTSTKLDLTGLEKEIQRKNLASYNVSFTSSCSPQGSQSVSMMDENRPIYAPTLKVRRSLFKLRKLSSGSEASPVKTASTLDEERSPCSAETFNKILSQIEIEEKSGKGSEVIRGFEKKLRWKGLETIREVDSIDISRAKSVEQTKRLPDVIKEPVIGDLDCFILFDKGLIREGMRHKIEEVGIIKEKEVSIKMKLTKKIETAAQDSLFE